MWEKVGGRKWVLLPPITNMRGRLTYILNLCVHSLIGYISSPVKKFLIQGLFLNYLGSFVLWFLVSNAFVMNLSKSCILIMHLSCKRNNTADCAHLEGRVSVQKNVLSFFYLLLFFKIIFTPPAMYCVSGLAPSLYIILGSAFKTLFCTETPNFFHSFFAPR